MGEVNGKQGLFPANHVELIGSLEGMESPVYISCTIIYFIQFLLHILLY